MTAVCPLGTACTSTRFPQQGHSLRASANCAWHRGHIIVGSAPHYTKPHPPSRQCHHAHDCCGGHGLTHVLLIEAGKPAILLSDSFILYTGDSELSNARIENVE